MRWALDVVNYKNLRPEFLSKIIGSSIEKLDRIARISQINTALLVFNVLAPHLSLQLLSGSTRTIGAGADG